MNNYWSCIIVSCRTLSSVIATEKEIEILKKKERIPHSVCVLTIEDPAENLGSGAATLNALLVAAEFLSAKKNFRVLSSDVLQDTHILILHNGRDYLYSSTSKAFISLPVEYSPEETSKPYASGIMSNLEAALLLIDKLSVASPSGVWVCSTDMMILHNQEISLSWENIADVVIFCVPSDIDYATQHGVVAIDEKGYVSNICYCGSNEQIESLVQSDGKVPLVSGIVFFKTDVAESLLSLDGQTPLDSCTYLGLDNGNEPIQVSLFFDLLLAMSTNLSKTSFISGQCSKTYNEKVGIQKEFCKESLLARSLVWDELSKYRITPKLLTGSQYLYWSNQHNSEHHISNLFEISSQQEIHSLYKVEAKSTLPFNSLMINSYICAEICSLSSNVIISDSLLDVHDLHIGRNSLLSGIKCVDKFQSLSFPDDLVIINYSMKICEESDLIVILGVKDNPTVPIDFDHGTFCNKSWSQIMKFLNVDDIWNSDLTLLERSVMNAKLFSSELCLTEVLKLFSFEEHNLELISKWKAHKRYSLNEIMMNIHYMKIFNHRRLVYAEISTTIIENTLLDNQDLHLLPYFYAAWAEDWSRSVMDVLDKSKLIQIDF